MWSRLKMLHAGSQGHMWNESKYELLHSKICMSSGTNRITHYPFSLDQRTKNVWNVGEITDYPLSCVESRD